MLEDSYILVVCLILILQRRYVRTANAMHMCIVITKAYQVETRDKFLAGNKMSSFYNLLRANYEGWFIETTQKKYRKRRGVFGEKGRSEEFESTEFFLFE